MESVTTSINSAILSHLIGYRHYIKFGNAFSVPNYLPKSKRLHLPYIAEVLGINSSKPNLRIAKKYIQLVISFSVPILLVYKNLTPLHCDLHSLPCHPFIFNSYLVLELVFTNHFNPLIRTYHLLTCSISCPLYVTTLNITNDVLCNN